MSCQAKAVPAFLGVERSLGGRRWVGRLTDERAALALAQRLDLPEAVARVLAARGIGAEDAPAWLAPRLRSALPDPAVLADMERAACRLADAVEAGEAIGVFGDYDVDGATSAALLARYLEAVGARAEIHIPDRRKEGYGPSFPALEALRERGAGPIVTVDCGTAAFEPLRLAAASGIDVIVLDHHLAGEALPAAFAVVNPNRADDGSGLGTLAAVGVTFMAVVALNRELRRRGRFAARPEPDALAWLDLVALGTICDQVPLTGLNRAFAAQGLKAMAGRANPGLAALADVAGIDEAPTAWHAGFVLGPRINAGGRVGSPHLGVRLLTTRDPDEAAGLAARLDELNGTRRAIEKEVLAAALAAAEKQSGRNCIVVADQGWHLGVVGIVASRIVERCRRPAVVVALDGEVGKGSGRSLAGVDLGRAVAAARCAGLLTAGGGHPMAAGLTVAREGLGALAAFLDERLADQVAALPARPELAIDGALAPAAATAALAQTVAATGPFGRGNAEPRFAVMHARIVHAQETAGGHVRCVAAGGDGGRMKAIAFGAVGGPTGDALLARDGRGLHLAGHLRLNRWQGAERVQFVVEDAAGAGEAPARRHDA